MPDADIVAVSSSSVFWVLAAAGPLRKWNRKRSVKRTGLVRTTRHYEHWVVEIGTLQQRRMKFMGRWPEAI